MRTAALALFLTLLCAPAAQAGAWLRAESSGFAASPVSINRNQESFTSAYLEYGLSERMTLGADIGYGFDLTGKQEGTGILFLRLPLAPADRAHKWALHLGLGTRYLNGEFLPAAELGLSWGRGLQWGERYGWANIDAVFNQPGSPAKQRLKIDGTLGFGLSAHIKVMAQLFSTFENGETYVKFAPSLLLAPGKGSTTWQIGLELPVAGGGESALKIGIWREF